VVKEVYFSLFGWIEIISQYISSFFNMQMLIITP